MHQRSIQCADGLVMLTLVSSTSAPSADAGATLRRTDFLGSRNQQALFAREEQLRAALKARDINPEKSARAFFYDPPWKLP
jgi:hypothetical protein